MSTSDQEDEVPSSIHADQPLQRRAHTYEEIAYSNDIRILKILHGNPGSGLECMLFPRSLWSIVSTSKSEYHDYWVLSYMWRDDEQTHPVIMYDATMSDVTALRDGLQTITRFNLSGTLNIRNNLAAALHQFRHVSKDVNVWVDVLCINQANMEERNAQISRMHEIYNEANCICVWLGAEEREMKETFEFLKYISNLETSDNLVKTKTNVEKWKLVVSLMKNGSFRRRWPHHELASARRAVVCWGLDENQWSDFVDALALFVTKLAKRTEILGKAYFGDSITQALFDVLENFITHETELDCFESKSIAVNPILLDSESDSDSLVSSLDSFAASAITSSVTSVSHMAPVAKDRTSAAHYTLSQELIVEARTQSQQQAAKFVGQKSRSISILIREKLHPSIRLNLPSHRIQIEGQNRLQRFLEEYQPVSTLEALYPPTPDTIRNEESDEEELEHDAPDDHPDLTRPKGVVAFS
ncbi:Heterokaryon incompatibility protein [Hyphodiscus hymeniophilus]|uniref:Heterokaryon incompatibility protein n=1 Tax=Hyphodiscus hymeniophilus TaxID=353542 RepID=A0A9P6VSQ6_9HELO|nr:Heterokaryon incompatibility protein [Hyphodiscus hymeniophilus]